MLDSFSLWRSEGWWFTESRKTKEIITSINVPTMESIFLLMSDVCGGGFHLPLPSRYSCPKDWSCLRSRARKYLHFTTSFFFFFLILNTPKTILKKFLDPSVALWPERGRLKLTRDYPIIFFLICCHYLTKTFDSLKIIFRKFLYVTPWNRSPASAW